MKKYVKQNTNTVHLIGDIRREYPNVSIPSDSDCSSFGYEFLIEQVAPSQDGFEAIELAPVNNVQQWELRPKPITVPRVLTPRQFRLALLHAGFLDDVEAMTADSREHQIYFEYSLDFERNHPLLVTMASAMGLTDTQIDELFILGGTL